MSAQFTEKDRALLAQYSNLPIIDTSTRRTDKRCRRLGWLTNHPPFGEGYRKRLTAPPLLFGTLIHDALDYGYRQKPVNYTSMVEYFADTSDDAINTIKQKYKPWLSEFAQYDGLRALGIGLLDEYARWAPNEDDFDVVVTEQAALVPIFSRSVHSLNAYTSKVVGLYYVRFDGIVRDNRGRLWVLEHKTCNRWWNQTMLDLDEQITAYTWAAEQWYGEPVAGVLMNFLLKEVVEDPPLLKDGTPTTALARLGKVTTARYAAALHPVDSSHGLRYTAEHDRTLVALGNREHADGHPTLRREKIERSSAAVRAQGARITDELVDMLDRGGRFTNLSTVPSPSFLCNSCSVRDVCVQMEHGDDWLQTLKGLYERGVPIWYESTVEEDDVLL